jgi:hypothetical protein
MSLHTDVPSFCWGFHMKQLRGHEERESSCSTRFCLLWKILGLYLDVLRS